MKKPIIHIVTLLCTLTFCLGLCMKIMHWPHHREITFLSLAGVVSGLVLISKFKKDS
jgi:hypothetical protein